MAGADELMLLLIGNPAVNTSVDIFPFLLSWYGASINKLHTSPQVIRDDFLLELNTFRAI